MPKKKNKLKLLNIPSDFKYVTAKVIVKTEHVPNGLHSKEEERVWVAAMTGCAASMPPGGDPASLASARAEMADAAVREYRNRFMRMDFEIRTDLDKDLAAFGLKTSTFVKTAGRKA